MRIAGISISSILSFIVLFLIFSPSCGNLFGRIEKRVAKEEQKAAERKIVRMEHSLMGIFYVAITVWVIFGLLVSIFPQVSEELEIEYWILVPVVWGVTLLMIGLTVFFSRKIVYGNGEFEYINAFGVRKKFKPQDITGIAVGNIFGMAKFNSLAELALPVNGNVKIFTEKGSFLLFRGMVGLEMFLMSLQEGSV